MKKKLIILGICFVLLLCSTMVYADNIEDLEQQKDVIEEQQAQTENEINNLQIQ